ncbi:MAG: hypothetical protein LVR00_09235 [Rhabdochlamydiaceae bacterium]|jgi:hypothetical protein
MADNQTNHAFILNPSSWLGEGKIQLNMVEEELSFFTKWNVAKKDEMGKIECVQEIQVKGLSDIMQNQFLFYDLSPGAFIIELENVALGKITGSGIISDKVIAWEFRVNEIGFEGFEFYEKQEDASYLMRAEYATADQFRTIITGKVWQQQEEKK